MHCHLQRICVLLFLLVPLCAFAEAVHEKPAELVLHRTLRYAMQYGDERLITLRVSKDFFARIVVEQIGLDVKVAILTPSGAQIAWVDRPNAAYGPEAISFIAPERGIYSVKITTSVPFSNAGKIHVRWVAYRSALPEDATRILAEKLCTEAAALRDSSQQETPQSQALSMFAESAELWRTLNDSYEIAIARYGEGITARSLGLYTEAEQYLQESITRMHRIKRPLGEAASWGALGFVYFAIGDQPKTTLCF